MRLLSAGRWFYTVPERGAAVVRENGRSIAGKGLLLGGRRLTSTALGRPLRTEPPEPVLCKFPTPRGPEICTVCLFLRFFPERSPQYCGGHAPAPQILGHPHEVQVTLSCHPLAMALRTYRPAGPRVEPDIV